MNIISILLRGIAIIPKKTGQFSFQKFIIPGDSREFKDTLEYETIESAVIAAEKWLTDTVLTFTGVIRYDRGLGAEYRQMDDFDAAGQTQAEEKAAKIAEDMFKNTKAKIHQIRVRQKYL